MKTLRPAAIVLLIAALLLPLVAACGPQVTATLPPPTDTSVPVPTQAPTQPPTLPPEPTQTATAEPAPVPAASYESAPCPFDLPAGQVEAETVYCGYLSVPEDRTDPGSPTIRLAVAVFRPGGTPEADPIFYINGGPGASSLELLQYTFAQYFQPLLAANRDIVFYDQRGVGLSKPVLDCPGMRQLGLDLLDEEIDGKPVGDEEAFALIEDAALACRTDLGKGAEVPAYNTEASAADVEDLRLALGYDRVNLWGTSYGTWLTLEVLRRYPEGIRSIVLDSVYPPDMDLLAETPLNAARSIDLFFATCAADEACNSAFPDLRGVYEATVERLNAEPARYPITNPLTRETYDVVMNGDNLGSFLFQFLYATNIIPLLPQILWDASQGTFTAVAQLMGSLLVTGESISSGQQITVLCRDEIAFGSEERFEKVIADHPELERAFADSILGEMGVRLCDQWQAGQADISVTQPVTSDLPTLIMSGEFDPITPPAWGRHVAETLSRSYFFEYPGVGHGASTVTGCPQEMMIAFLANPSVTPDAACIDGMKDWSFVVPSEPASIELVPFTSSTFGIQGLVPKGWTETAQPGVYTRGASATDVTALIEQAAAMSASDLLALLTQQLALGAAPESVAQREANGLAWSLYAVQVQGLSVDIALAESAGKGMVVLLQTDPKEHDGLYQAVFLPAVDALVPVQ
jgi:pimeloyl-ACP methyl ester carboxylesterase